MPAHLRRAALLVSIVLLTAACGSDPEGGGGADTIPDQLVTDTRDAVEEMAVDTAEPPCASSMDCPEGLACDIETGECGACRVLSECRPGESCVAGVCGDCAQDLDCLGQICEAGACAPCTDSARCEVGYAAGFTCQQNRCAPASCETGADCRLNGQVCLSNACSPCVGDADCLAEGSGDYPSDAACVEGVCVQPVCEGDGDCDATLPICGDRSACRGCQTTSECQAAAPGEEVVCDPETGRCEPGDCYPPGSVCGDAQLCGDDFFCGDCVNNAACAAALDETHLCIEGQCIVADCNGELPCGVDEACDAESYSCRACTDPQDCCIGGLAPPRCFIDDVCYQAGDADPTTACFGCAPDLSSDAWMPDDTLTCGDDTRCVSGACETLCGGVDWVNLAVDNDAHCGACENDCGMERSCVNQLCECNGNVLLRLVSPWLPDHGQVALTAITAPFACPIDPATFNAATARLYAQGPLALTYDATDPMLVQILFTDRPLLAGEVVSVTMTTEVLQESGVPFLGLPWVWQLRNSTQASSGVLADSGQALGLTDSVEVVLGDLDGDGDLDALVIDSDASRVWLNDGAGVFVDSAQVLGDASHRSAALGDLDGDGDLDAFVVSDGLLDAGAPNLVWFNDGVGNFTDSGQALGDAESQGVALGDLDGDGDLDAFVANGAVDGVERSAPNRVWLNDGVGVFIDGGQGLGDSVSFDVALDDLDGDGDLDAFVANGGSVGNGNRAWLNLGDAMFSNAPGMHGASSSRAVILGDVEGDGDVDAFIANEDGPDVLWLNSGIALFGDRAQPFDDVPSTGVALVDIEGDGDLDVFFSGATGLKALWLNDGQGFFSDSGQTFSTSRVVTTGDLDLDGDVDLFLGAPSAPNTVWFNQ